MVEKALKAAIPKVQHHTDQLGYIQHPGKNRSTRKGVKTAEEDPQAYLEPCFSFSGRPWGAIPLLPLPAARWTVTGQTRSMLSAGGGSCHGQPGRYQDGISGLCLDDKAPHCVPVTAEHPQASFGPGVMTAVSAWQRDSWRGRGICCRCNIPHPGRLPSPYVQRFEIWKL